jgi:TonB family protein
MLVTYILQVTICLACFYAFYHLVLHKETLFETNRVYLLVTVLISLVLPLIRIYVQTHQQETNIVTMPYVYVGSYLNEMNDAIKVTPAQQAFPWLYIIQLIYLLGVLVTGLHLINEIVTIFTIKRKGEIKSISGHLCILSEDVKSPFSFFNTIYLPVNHHFNENELDEIISHEKAHVKSWHSIDIVFMELVCIGLWPSPMVYLFRKKLREVHEFLADAEVLKNTPWENYASFLLSQKGVGLQNHLSNQMFYSQLKNRLIMMNKRRSFQSAGLKYLGILPILLLALVVFSFREKSLTDKNTDPNIVLKVSRDKKYFLDGLEIPYEQLEQSLSERIKNNPELMVYVNMDSTLAVGEIDKVLSLGKKFNVIFTLESKDQKPDLAKFLIVIEKTENELKLTCKNGCEWNALTFTSPESKVPQTIDQFGLKTGSRKQLFEFSGYSNFLFTIKEEGTGVSLIGLEGTAWTKLSFTRPKNMWIQAIDQHGMTTIDEQGQSTSVAHLHYYPKDTLSATVVTAYRITESSSDVDRSSEYKPDPNIYEDMAIFPGCEDVPIQDRGMCGQKNLLGYINTHLVYPQSLKKSGIEGKVIVSFTVGIDGYVKRVVIENSLNPDADEAVLNVFKNMNKDAGRWLPARKEGKTMEAEMTLPIIFSLDSAKEKTIWDEPYEMVEQMPRFPGCEQLPETTKSAKISNGSGNIPSGSTNVKVSSKGKILKENTDYSIDYNNGRITILNQAFLKAEIPINVVFEERAKSDCATEAMFKYIYGAINYPQEDREKGIEGAVVAKFTVTADGNISNIKVVRGVSPGLNAEIIRVINSMNDLPEKWIPGKNHGNAVPVELTLPFKFVLQDKEKNENKPIVINNFPEVENQVSISISPNPANTYVRIEVPINVTAISIFDSSGKLILNNQLNENQLNKNQDVDVSKWNSGTYVAQLISGSKTSSTTFIVQH